MKYLQLLTLPDRKHEAIAVYDTEKNTSYIVGYILHNKDLFIEALTNFKYEIAEKDACEELERKINGYKKGK